MYMSATTFFFVFALSRNILAISSQCANRFQDSSSSGAPLPTKRTPVIASQRSVANFVRRAGFNKCERLRIQTDKYFPTAMRLCKMHDTTVSQ